MKRSIVQLVCAAVIAACALVPVLGAADTPRSVVPPGVGPPDPESGQTRLGSWLAHNEQGGPKAKWFDDEAADAPVSHLTVKAGITVPIEWYKFGFTLDDTRLYTASLRITYRADPDEPTGYPVIGVIQNGEFKPHNEQGVSVPSIALAPTGGEWLTVLVPLGVFHGEVLNAPETACVFDVGPTLDLGFKVWVMVEIVATPG